jgi:hypothetical protein
MNQKEREVRRLVRKFYDRFDDALDKVIKEEQRFNAGYEVKPKYKESFYLHWETELIKLISEVLRKL